MQNVSARKREWAAGIDGRAHPSFDPTRREPLRSVTMLPFLLARRGPPIADVPRTVDADGTRRVGPAWARRLEGLWILHVTGDRQAMN